MVPQNIYLRPPIEQETISEEDGANRGGSNTFKGMRKILRIFPPSRKIKSFFFDQTKYTNKNSSNSRFARIPLESQGSLGWFRMLT